jgi:hypothetical protein
MLMTQVMGVTAKSRLGEPAVSETNEVRMPLLCAVSEAVTGWELVPTIVVPGKVSGVVGIWAAAPPATASTPVAASGHRFSASNMFDPAVRRVHVYLRR